MASSFTSVASGEEAFQVFEGGEVDAAVGEHAEEAQGEAAVERADAGGRSHFLEGGDDESVSTETAGDGFVLHATAQGWSVSEEKRKDGKEDMWCG